MEIKKYKNLLLLLLNQNYFQRQNKIGIQGCQSVSKAIKNMTNLNKLILNLNYNNIEDQGLNYIAQAIIKLNKLTHFVIKADYCFINKKGLTYLNQSVSELLILEKLAYYLNGNQLGNGGFSSFSLLNDNNKIKELCLQFNSIQIFEDDISQLGNFLSSLKILKYLQLSFDSSKLNQEALRELGLQISKSQSIQILYLSLKDNKIKQEDIIQLVEAIQGLSNLREIIIDCYHNNIGLGQKGLSQLGKALSNFQQLQRISLNLNMNLLENNHIFDLSQELKNCKNLLQIQLYAQDNLISNQCNFKTKVLFKKLRRLVLMYCCF
ncbi:hypothetical protein TTHERM_000255629 (macronuclear) [Tetrahymena thermophila SB210]|uniref:Kinase domain protein n=1 Tax=Tetrahymena thermophila (strain SB210) TaxID=312017 RepID=W7XIU9_TETTS|nr:hypothetical protein TTHERM_000255629 [Tetrahymena thermophila SB210]EWS73624.1 hypothetical protein TTHERM_000255629 [Tetrahymena thermophila SB210]|eukprot:XP_012653854.1 hypothetical protein TTHERM_000255629 [Tetrahymena thermophila SB210]